MCDGSVASIASPIISLVTGKNEYEINALIKKASVIFKQKIYNNSKMQYTLFFICNENPVSVLRENAIHTIYLYLCPSLPLSKYIQWRSVKREWGARGVEGCYTPFHFSEPYQIYAKYCWKIFPNTVLSVNRDPPNKQLKVITCESDHF